MRSLIYIWVSTIFPSIWSFQYFSLNIRFVFEIVRNTASFSVLVNKKNGYWTVSSTLFESRLTLSWNHTQRLHHSTKERIKAFTLIKAWVETTSDDPRRWAFVSMLSLLLLTSQWDTQDHSDGKEPLFHTCVKVYSLWWWQDVLNIA